MKIHEETLAHNQTIKVHLLVDAIERMQGISAVHQFNKSLYSAQDGILRKEIIISTRLPNIHA